MFYRIVRLDGLWTGKASAELVARFVCKMFLEDKTSYGRVDRANLMFRVWATAVYFER